jgi:hypothetical protein
MSDKNDVVIINLDRPRSLRFGHKALKAMLSSTGKSLEDMKIDGSNLEEVEMIMYYGLQADAQKNNERLTLEKMEDLLDDAPSFGHVLEKLTEALNKAFNQAEEDRKNLQRVAMKKAK